MRELIVLLLFSATFIFGFFSGTYTERAYYAPQVVERGCAEWNTKGQFTWKPITADNQ